MIAPPLLSRKAETIIAHLGLSYDDLLGVRFAINVFIASTIVWFGLQRLADSNPIWAIAAMVASSEPQTKEARRFFRSRLLNVLVGCVIGFSFLLAGSRTDWTIPFALAITVLVSTLLVRVKTMWRQAPITAVIVLAAGLSAHSTLGGVYRGLHKVAEVVFGSLVGILVSWLMSKVWLVRPPRGNGLSL